MISDNIRTKILYFRNHRFVRNLATLQTGNILGNIFQAAAGIIMARILQPEMFGIYALSFGLAGLIGILMSVGAQDAVITILGGAYAQNDKEKIRDSLGYLAKMTIITGILAFVGALLAPVIAGYFYSNYNIGFYSAIVISASIISTTSFSFAMIVLQVVGRIKDMTKLGFANNTLRTLFALAFVSMGFGVLGLTLGHLLGAIIIFISAAFLWRSVQRQYPIFPSIREIIKRAKTVSIKKYFNFSFLIALDRNLSNLYNILPITLTGIYLSTSEVTFFKLAFSYINLALSLFGPIGTLLNVEFPRIQALDDTRLARNFMRVSLYSFLLSTLITLGVIMVAPFAFKIFYGENFSQSVFYVYGLAGYGCIMGLGMGLGSMMRTLNVVSFSVKLHIISLSLGIPLGLFMIKSWGLMGTVALVTIWYSTIIIVAFFFVVGALKKFTQINRV